MKLFMGYIAAARTTLLLLPLLSYAQSSAELDVSSRNLTLRFFPQTDEETCSFEDSRDALTFTSSGQPVLHHCFNFADLFGGNSSRGFVNQTDHLVWPDSSGNGQAGIFWQLRNLDKFDSQANYSRILYRQHVTGSDDRYASDSYAFRRVNIYGGLDCTEVDPAGSRELLDWYGFSCFSESEGTCGTTPYSIASFTVQPGHFDDADEQDGQCLTFSQTGTAARHQLPSKTLGVLTFGIAALWLTS